MKKNNFPFSATLINGKKILIHNPYECHMISSKIFDGYSFKDNLMIIKKSEFPEIKLDLGKNNGDVLGIFFNKEYEFLEVEDKVVLDIGANIADSSIYFALKGAKKVIALEPFPKNYALAEKNIHINNLDKKIFLEKAACASKNNVQILNPNLEGPGIDAITSNNFNGGVQIRSITIKDLIIKHNIPDDSVLKIDCEGCEVDLLLNIEKEVLQKFSFIQIEYHYGYKDLKQKLNFFGFHVTHSLPTFLRNPQARNQSMCLGFLFAKKIKSINCDES